MGKAKLFGLGLLMALGLTARGASAQAVGAAFGHRGSVAISAERLLGVYVLNAEVEQNGTATFGGPGGGAVVNINRKIESDTTTFVLLGNDDAAGPASLPRLAVDFFVIDGLSIGGSLLYWHDSQENDTTGTNQGPGGGGPNPIDRVHVETDRTTWGIAPRVGYAYMFTPTLGIWPRGGFSYVSSKTETTTQTIDAQDGSVDQEDTDQTLSAFLFDLEGLFVLAPFEHVAFGVGPFFQISLTGDAETNSTPNPTHLEGDLKATSFGVTSALIAWF
jgi:hypothetical protein